MTDIQFGGELEPPKQTVVCTSPTRCETMIDTLEFTSLSRVYTFWVYTIRETLDPLMETTTSHKASYPSFRHATLPVVCKPVRIAPRLLHSKAHDHCAKRALN